MSIKAAFNLLISIHSRKVVIKRRGTVLEANIRVAPSNYFRNLEVSNQITSEGQEFVSMKDDFGSFGKPKKGDIIEDPDFGILTIRESRPMYDLGASIIGYRIRTD